MRPFDATERTKHEIRWRTAVEFYVMRIETGHARSHDARIRLASLYRRPGITQEMCEPYIARVQQADAERSGGDAA